LGHGLSLSDFARAALRGPIWARDIDAQPDDSLIEAVAKGTGISIARVTATTLSFWRNLETQLRVRIILPVSAGPSKRRRHGLQCCPHCLLHDPVRYYRRAWRLAHAVVCHMHGVELLDACQSCHRPVRVFERRPIDHNDTRIQTRCLVCGYELTGAARVAPTILLEFQDKLLQARSFEIMRSVAKYYSSLRSSRSMHEARLSDRTAAMLSQISMVGSSVPSDVSPTT
jgi:hypothetical protein